MTSSACFFITIPSQLGNIFSASVFSFLSVGHFFFHSAFLDGMVWVGVFFFSRGPPVSINKKRNHFHEMDMKWESIYRDKGFSPFCNNRIVSWKGIWSVRKDGGGVLKYTIAIR